MGRHKDYAESLLAERAAYAGRRDHDRVAVFDAELARLGWGVDAGELVPLSKVKQDEDQAVTAEASAAEPEDADAKAARRPRERAVSKAPETAVDAD